MSIKLFSLFSGYGGAEFALKKAGIDFWVVGYSEIDKFAIECYEQNHCNIGIETDYWGDDDNIWEDYRQVQVPIQNYGDITKIREKELPDFDLLTGGFPCQSFSVAGKSQGELDTRGTLFADIIRIAEYKQPKFILLENVKGLISEKHQKTYKKIISELSRIGYKIVAKVLNSKDYGIPQNRERIWIVCIRRDIDKYFEFPQREEYKLFLKDILEEKVDEKYYLKKESIDKLLEYNERNKKNGNGFSAKFHRENEVMSSLKVVGKGSDDLVAIPVLTPDRLKKRQNGRRFKTDGEPMFSLNCQDRHGILQINNSKHSNDRIYSDKGISPTLNTMQGGNRQPFIESDYRIRKLTPKECFRLMGFLKDEINLENISDSQKYKLAGNGWEISVVSEIFKNLLK